MVFDRLEDDDVPSRYVLSRDSGKGQAVSFVLNHYYNQSAEILIARDTGNDADMVELGYPSVIVGNSHPELHYLVDRPHVYKAAATHAVVASKKAGNATTAVRLGRLSVHT